MNQTQLFKLLSLFIIVFSIIATQTFASNNTRKIILTGKVTNSDYGNPVANHQIFIISESVNSKNANYSKTVITDDEGFYFDTLTTSLNKGSFQVFTYDYNNKIQEKKLYFRFTDLSASNIFVADFNIYMPFQSEQVQAQFKYAQKNNDNRFHYQFIDQTNYQYIDRWHWDFGDGNESNVQNPEHTYAEPGLYKIKLVVTATTRGNQQISSFSKYIYVSERSYYHLGGHCFAGYFPIDMGKAILYYINDYQKFIPVDTATFDKLGYYYFYEIPEGNYCIKVQPENASEYYGQMVPTYFGDNVFWEMAKHISHQQTNWEYDIHLVEGYGTDQGKCSINGNVFYGDTLTSSKNSPAAGIDFMLMNEDGLVLSSNYSDDKGNFSFEKIKAGIYWLTPDVTGYEQKKKMIELTDENPDFLNIEITIENGDINMDVPNELLSDYNFLGKLYPNPAGNWVKIEIAAINIGNWTFEILDSQGKKLKSENIDLQKGNQVVSLNISNLKNGHYILLIENEGKSTGRSLVVSK